MCFLDVCEIKIGDNTLIGPHTQIYTACHSIDPQERLKKLNLGKQLPLGIMFGLVETVLFYQELRLAIIALLEQAVW